MKSCLIVDDSRVIRKILRQIFESMTFVCDEAENGQMALDACKAKSPDLIILDWNMPVMNGLEFIRVLRQVQNNKPPIVIFCTIENDLAHITEALKAGANEYIMKPFDADIIRGKLEQLGLVSV